MLTALPLSPAFLSAVLAHPAYGAGRCNRSPCIWHFAFHSIPGLPERLVQGRQADYLDYFYEVRVQAAALRAITRGIVPGAGHFGPEEQPDQTWHLISGFLRA